MMGRGKRHIRPHPYPPPSRGRGYVWVLVFIGIVKANRK